MRRWSTSGNIPICLASGNGRSVLDLVHPAGQPAAREAHARLLVDHGQPMRHETRLVRAGGQEIPVQVTASWVDGDPAGQRRADHQ